MFYFLNLDRLITISRPNKNTKTNQFKTNKYSLRDKVNK